MTTGLAVLSLCLQTLSEAEPSVMPAVVIARRDLLRGQEHLAEIGAAVGGVGERAQRLEPELGLDPKTIGLTRAP
jgi:hypothetical protein